LRRARAVDGVLHEEGIRTSKPEGRGERVLKCNPETSSDGKTLDRGKLACNRRVEIVVRTKGAA
jgi:outer membrane protein OmpA-like peptidoglycan-associated protein